LQKELFLCEMHYERGCQIWKVRFTEQRIA